MTLLTSLGAESIAHAIADASARWCDADFPPRVRATARIVERTGYSEPVVDYALDRFFESVTFDALSATVRHEIGGFAILDGFQPRAGRTSAWAAPVGNVCIISSRTTIGVALTPAVFALCARCSVLVKDREDALIASFFETLAEERAEFSAAATAERWDSGDEHAPDLRSFDAVVAFGRDDTLARIRDAMRADARFIGYGARASAGYIAREDLSSASAAQELARGAARDIVLYDTEGCLSLHLLFVEDGGTIGRSEFSRILAEAIEAANVEFPAGAATAARASHARALSGFRNANGSSNAPAFVPRGTEPQPAAAPADALAFLREHRVALEGFALSSARADLIDLASQAGAVRITRFGELQSPPLSGNHGGRPGVADFVRWIDRAF